MDYLAHLAKDKKLLKILSEPLPPLVLRDNIPLRLMASIMGQQLSVKVARVIFKRFLEIYGGNEPRAIQVLDTPFETLRAIGLSNAKVSYVQNVARFCVDNKLKDKVFHSMSNDEIITMLTEIKGVGKWTVEMLLMFSLAREDVFAVDDLGIQQAMIKVYKLDVADKKKLREQMVRLSVKWSPYRTYACLHLWQHKDNVKNDS